MTDDTTVFLGAHVPSDVAEQVREIAERDERPVAWVIRQALKNHVANFGAEDNGRKAAA